MGRKLAPIRAGRAISAAPSQTTHLRLGQHQAGGNLEALRPRQVLACPELVLQLEQLLRGERGARPPRLVQHVRAYSRFRRKRASRPGVGGSLVRVALGLRLLVKWATRVKI